MAGCILTSATKGVYAASTISVYDGVNPLITMVDNGPGDGIGATGVIMVQTNVGVWNLAIFTGLTKPLLGSATDPVMDLLVQASSSSAGSLRVTFSDSDFGPATGTLNAIVDGHVANGAGATATYDVYGDPANVVGATTVHIASAGTTALPTSVSVFGPLTLPTLYSLTQVAQYDAAGPPLIQSDASFSVLPVPEPGVLGLGALSLAVFALGRPRHSKA